MSRHHVKFVRSVLHISYRRIKLKKEGWSWKTIFILNIRCNEMATMHCITGISWYKIITLHTSVIRLADIMQTFTAFGS
jgi:hypothetical protein